MEYASGGATSAQVARGLGVSPTAVRNWKRSMLTDDKERTIAHRTRTGGQDQEQGQDRGRVGCGCGLVEARV